MAYLVFYICNYHKILIDYHLCKYNIWVVNQLVENHLLLIQKYLSNKLYYHNYQSHCNHKYSIKIYYPLHTIN
jgi:hypothetical protein